MNGNLLQQSECQFCNASIESEALELNGRIYGLAPNICDSCDALRNDGKEANLQARFQRITTFRSSIPRIFRDTEWHRLPATLTEAITSWSYGPHGLAFAGPSGRCKTRAMFLVLEREAGNGKSVDFITSTDFDYLSREQFSDDAMERNSAKDKLRSMRSVKVLLLDDLGKSRLTDRCEAELFALFDARTSAGLPTLWTSNLGAEGLKAMVSPDRAAPLLRRLTEFTKIINP